MGVTVLFALFAASRIVISEVMANPAGPSGARMPEDRNEFIELYNPAGTAVDLAGWRLSDGDAEDVITVWTDSSLLASDSALVINYSWLDPGCYAVVLDPEYTDPAGAGGHLMPYRFGVGTLVLTIGNTTIGNGLAGSDPLTLSSPYGDSSTFGTPADASDSFPTDAGDGISWERADLSGDDVASNWLACRDTAGCTPGRANSAVTWIDLAVSGIELANSDTLEPGRSATARVSTTNLGVPDVGNCTLSVFLDRNNNGIEDKDENVTRFCNWTVKGRHEAETTAAFPCPDGRTDLWARLVCPGDADSTNNSARLTLMPGGSNRLFDLNLSSFSPDGDGFEESLGVLYRLPEAKGVLSVTVFDLGGRHVATLFSGRPPAARGVVSWDGRSKSGRRAAVGVYAVCVEYRASGTTRAGKLPVVLLRK